MKKCKIFKVYFTCENDIDVYLFEKIAIYVYIYFIHIYIYIYIYECLYREKADRISLLDNTINNDKINPKKSYALQCALQKY